MRITTRPARAATIAIAAALALGAAACSDDKSDKATDAPATTNPFGNVSYAEIAGGAVPVTTAANARGVVAQDKAAAEQMLQDAGIGNLGTSLDAVDFGTAFVVLAVGKTVQGSEFHAQAAQANVNGNEMDVQLVVHDLSDPSAPQSQALNAPYTLLLVQRSSVPEVPTKVNVSP